MSAPLLPPALEAHGAGFCVIPASNDGSKQPYPDRPQWKKYESERPAEIVLRQWFSEKANRYSGFGLVLGKVSGNGECLEFEGRAVAEGVWDAYKAAAIASGLGDVLARICVGYFETSPSGGVHLLYRVDGLTECIKLAMRPASADELTVNDKDKIKTLIETKGEGGFIIVAPSNGRTHPTGGAWVLVQGSFATVVTITADERAALLDLARSFDQTPTPLWQPSTTRASDADGRPGDDFNSNGDPLPALVNAGWVKVYGTPDDNEAWRRPGKDKGVSATWHPLKRVFYVHSSSTVFPESPKGYSPFAVVAFVEHEGNFAAAASTLAAQGYGEPLKPVDFTQWIAELRAAGHDPEGASEYLAARERGAAIKPEKINKNRMLNMVDLQTVEAQDVDWLWQDRIPIGMVTLAVGDPGDGKSYVFMSLSSMISRGEPLPAVELGTVPRDVILANYEDPAEQTMRPRADRAGGFGAGHIWLIDNVTEDGEDRPFGPTDVDLLDATLDEHPDVVMLVIDPIGSYLPGNVDSGRDNQVRNVLGPLANIARRHHVAVVGVVHLNKTDAQQIIYRVSGSVGGFVGIARSVLLVGKDNESGRRAVAQIKSNVGPLAPPIEFQISADGIEWKGVADDLTPDRLLASPAKRTKGEDAADWLRSYMNGQACLAAPLLAAAEEAGFNSRTVHRAADDIGMDKVQAPGEPGKRGKGPWTWFPPGVDRPEAWG